MVYSKPEPAIFRTKRAKAGGLQRTTGMRRINRDQD
jgi:hypothetical protein